MKETKQSILAKLTLMVNLSEEIGKLGEQLCESLAPNGEDDLYDMDDLYDIINQIPCGERTDAKEILSELEEKGYLKEAGILEEGDNLSIPKLKVARQGYLELLKPTRGGTLIAWVGESDCDTHQAGVSYRMDHEPEIDLLLAEVKGGELAEESDRDIHYYAFSDPRKEDYVENGKIRYEEIKEVMKECATDKVLPDVNG